MIWPDVLPVLPNDVAFVQQSSSYRSPVLKKGSTCRCQAVTTVRGPFSPRFPFSQRVKSMKSVSFAILRKLELGRHLRPCVKKILWLLMTSSDGFQESSHYQESLFLFQFRARMSRASNNFCHAGRTKICPRSKSCQSCPLNGHSCSNPVHSNHQYRTESTHASVKQ